MSSTETEVAAVEPWTNAGGIPEAFTGGMGGAGEQELGGSGGALEK